MQHTHHHHCHRAHRRRHHHRRHRRHLGHHLWGGLGVCSCWGGVQPGPAASGILAGEQLIFEQAGGGTAAHSIEHQPAGLTHRRHHRRGHPDAASCAAKRPVVFSC